MTAANQQAVISITLTGVSEQQAQNIITALASNIQTLLTAHGVGGILTIGANYSESLTP